MLPVPLERGEEETQPQILYIKQHHVTEARARYEAGECCCFFGGSWLESPSKRTRSGQGLTDDSNSDGTEGGRGAAVAVMGALEGGAGVPAV